MPVQARGAAPEIAGLYDGGQTEVAAALYLGDDGRFEYAMSYGAVDETAAGTWTSDGDTVVLTSDPVQAPAFELLAAEQAGGDAFHVDLELPASLPLEAYSALITLADGSAFAADFGADGLHLELAPQESVASIMLALTIFDLRSETFAVPAGANRLRFGFTPNDLGKVPFNQAVLPMIDGAYVLERLGVELRFEKIP